MMGVTNVTAAGRLTFYQPGRKKTMNGNIGHINRTTFSSVQDVSYATTNTTRAYNEQLNRYISNCNQEQKKIIQETLKAMKEKLSENPGIKNYKLRHTSNWSGVKKLVVREELMKLQISKKCDLPISPEEQKRIYNLIKNKDLSQLNDAEIKSIINDIIATDKQKILQALKAFKATGAKSPLLQKAKLEQLKEELENIDLDKITSKELKSLIKKYCEKIEFHHGTSVSKDPKQQSNADNIEPLSSSEHKARHRDSETGKVDYKKPVDKKPVDRNKQMKNANKKRVKNNELRGLGLAVAIGAGIGFTIGFITTLAQSGVSPENLKLATIEGAKTSIEGGILSAVSYGIGRTIGNLATKAGLKLLEKIGVEITEAISKSVNMGIIGALSAIIFSAYQFAKLKLNGVNTREALRRSGKQALVSFSLLAVTIGVNYAFGNTVALIVSAGIGVVMIAYSVTETVHQRHFAEKIRVYTIDKCRPVF